MVLAQNPLNGINVPVSGGAINPNSATLGELVTVLIPYILGIGGLILLLNILWSGLSMMLSRGEPKAYEGARGRFTAGLIGFVIMFAAYWIVQIVASMLNLNAIKTMFP